MQAPPLLLCRSPFPSVPKRASLIIYHQQPTPATSSRINPHFLFHLNHSVSLMASSHGGTGGRNHLLKSGGGGGQSRTGSDTTSWQLGPTRDGWKMVCVLLLGGGAVQIYRKFCDTNTRADGTFKERRG